MQVPVAGSVKMSVFKERLASYVNLMKPHVTVLLLGTTLAAMAIAQRGFPPLDSRHTRSPSDPNAKMNAPSVVGVERAAG